LTFDELAHQRDGETISKTQAGLKGIDVAMLIWLLIGVDIDFALALGMQ
jgi:hypothetical protein